MATKIVIRNDTKNNWESENPTLSMGEFGLESDTGKIKVGDGISSWLSLSYYPTPDKIDSSGVESGEILTSDGNGGVNWTSSLDHDQLINYEPNEHIDWTIDQSANFSIHDKNINKSAITQYCYNLNELGIAVIEGGNSSDTYENCSNLN